MTRKAPSSLGIAACIALLAIGTAACAPASAQRRTAASPTPTRPPNIIILFADDLGYGDLGSYGHPTIRTPALDQMAREGARFTQFYAASPACSHSRYSLLTGRLPIRSGFGSWVLSPKSERGMHTREITLAEGLKAGGYATAAFGKWHLGTTDPGYLPLQQGFDEYFGLPYSNDMRPPKHGPLPLMEGNDTIATDPDQTTLTGLYTDRATRFIRTHRQTPFFLYVAYAMPHIPLYPGASFEGRSRRGRYGDVVEEIDGSVGRVLETLRSEGLAEQTLVIFLSDNGPWIIKGENAGSAGLLRDGKGSTWEGGIRVPFIAWQPGSIPAGGIQMEPATAMDLFPTLLRMAGQPVPSDRPIDGHSIEGLLTSAFDPDGTASAEPEPLFFYGSKELHAVRYGAWKLHIATGSQTGRDYFGDRLPLLFDLEHDPSEEHDVAEDHPDVVSKLTAILEAHRRAIHEAGTFFDAPAGSAR